MALDEFLSGMAHLQQHLRLLAPPGVRALEKVTEKPFLQCEAVVRVEMCPVFTSMAFEPLLSRCRTDEPFEIATGVQTLPAPVSGRQQRRLHLAPVGHAGLPILVGIELA